MKLFILLVTGLSLSLANEIRDFDNVRFELNPNLVEEFLEKYDAATKLRGQTNAGIVAVINEYADKIFANIQTFSLSNGLDPVSLDNVSQHFLTASLTLDHGLLNGISTLNRTDDIEVKYQSSTKELELHLPFVFSNLNFTYDYHVVVLLIGPRGSMTGKIKNFKMDITLVFDFKTYQARIKSLKTTDSGHVSLTFHGNGVLDLVTNILTEFVTTILHPMIVLVIEGIVSNVMKQVVTSVNGAINGTLHPPVEAIAVLY